jgi:hypothetical protein
MASLSATVARRIARGVARMAERTQGDDLESKIQHQVDLQSNRNAVISTASQESIPS